jgi:hypothetical protein
VPSFFVSFEHQTGLFVYQVSHGPLGLLLNDQIVYVFSSGKVFQGKLK